METQSSFHPYRAVYVKLVIEICLYTPWSNASLELFFNQLKIVKTEQRTTLTDNSLNSILLIKLRGNSVTEFNNMYLVVLKQPEAEENSPEEEERIPKKEICEKVACVF